MLMKIRYPNMFIWLQKKNLVRLYHLDRLQKTRQSSLTGIVLINFLSLTCRYCPECKAHREATKQLSVWRLPECLIIHLKRFSFRNILFKDKITKLVDFPLRLVYCIARRNNSTALPSCLAFSHFFDLVLNGDVNVELRTFAPTATAHL